MCLCLIDLRLFRDDFEYNSLNEGTILHMGTYAPDESQGQRSEKGNIPDEWISLEKNDLQKKGSQIPRNAQIDDIKKYRVEHEEKWKQKTKDILDKV